MKEINLKNETSNIIKKHLVDGWTLDWDDTSRGCQACYILLKENKVRFVYVTWEKNLYSKTDLDNVVEIGVCEDLIENRDRCGIWREREKIIFKRMYYRLGERQSGNEWYTTDMEEAITAKKKRIARYQNNYIGDKDVSFEATEAIAETMRKVPGFEKATKKNLRIQKTRKYLAFQGRRYGYQVELLNRVGNIKESRFYQLG